MLKTQIQIYKINKTTILKNKQENLTSLTIFNIGKTNITYNEVFVITPNMGVNGIVLIDSQINPVSTKNLLLSFDDDKNLDNEVIVSISQINKTCQ